MAKNGFALGSKEEVLDVVKDYVEQNSLAVPLQNNRPGHDWYISFCRRQRLSLNKKMMDSLLVCNKNYFTLIQHDNYITHI